jgi:hypothetical protein
MNVADRLMVSARARAGQRRRERKTTAIAPQN